jgi:hypothetical protein
MVVAPVDDLQGLADRIDFGEVLSVDEGARIIDVKIAPDRL